MTTFRNMKLEPELSGQIQIKFFLMASKAETKGLFKLTACNSNFQEIDKLDEQFFCQMLKGEGMEKTPVLAKKKNSCFGKKTHQFHLWNSEIVPNSNAVKC